MRHYATSNWHAACNRLSDHLWTRDVLGKNSPRTSRLIRTARAQLRQVERDEPTIALWNDGTVAL